MTTKTTMVMARRGEWSGTAAVGMPQAGDLTIASSLFDPVPTLGESDVLPIYPFTHELARYKIFASTIPMMVWPLVIQRLHNVSFDLVL